MGLPYDLVELVEYDPNWDNLYHNELIIIRNAINDESVDIYHIGSTSIPGMIAKPIIDIMVGVNNVDEAYCYVKLLENVGYRCLGECGRQGRTFFVKGSAENCTHHLHLVEKGSCYWTENLLFRDCLANNPETAAEYAQIKQSLAKRYRTNRDLYRVKKSAYVEKIIQDLIKQKLSGCRP